MQHQLSSASRRASTGNSVNSHYESSPLAERLRLLSTFKQSRKALNISSAQLDQPAQADTQESTDTTVVMEELEDEEADEVVVMDEEYKEESDNKDAFETSYSTSRSSTTSSKSNNHYKDSRKGPTRATVQGGDEINQRLLAIIKDRKRRANSMSAVQKQIMADWRTRNSRRKTESSVGSGNGSVQKPQRPRRRRNTARSEGTADTWSPTTTVDVVAEPSSQAKQPAHNTEIEIPEPETPERKTAEPETAEPVHPRSPSSSEELFGNGSDDLDLEFEYPSPTGMHTLAPEPAPAPTPAPELAPTTQYPPPASAVCKLQNTITTDFSYSPEYSMLTPWLSYNGSDGDGDVEHLLVDPEPLYEYTHGFDLHMDCRTCNPQLHFQHHDQFYHDYYHHSPLLAAADDAASLTGSQETCSDTDSEHLAFAYLNLPIEE